MTIRTPVIAALVMACAGGLPLLYGSTPANPDSGSVRVVVANQRSATATIMDGDGSAVRHIEVGNGPHEAAVSPDGGTAVVTIYGAGTPGNQLAVIDLDRGVVVRTIDLGQWTRPHGVVFLGGSNDRIAVTSESTGNLVLVNLASGEIDVIPTRAPASHMVAVDAAGTRAWTANITGHSVSELDLINRRFVRTFSVPERPEGIAVTPDGRYVWVGSNTTGAVTVIDTGTGDVVSTLGGYTMPYRLGASPDGSRIVIVDAQGGRIGIADAGLREEVGSIGLDSPRGVAIAPDNRTAYVTLAGGQLAIVDLVDQSVKGMVAVQASPDGVGVGVAQGTSAQPAAAAADSILFAVEIRTGPNWDSTKPANEQSYFREHSANLHRLREAGNLRLGARYGDKGFVVLAAPSETAARAMVQQDPSIQHGTFAFELHQFRVFYDGAVARRPAS